MIDLVLYPYQVFDRNVLALMMIAILSSYLGVYVVCKRIVFVGVALAEVSAMGIGFAFFATGWAMRLGIEETAWEETAPLLASVVFTLAGVVFFGLRLPGRRVSQEGMIGVGYCIAAGLAVLLIWESAEGLDALRNLVAGDVLIVSDLQFGILAATFIFLLVVHLALHKEFLFASLDQDTARTLLLPARTLDLALYLSVGISVAVCLRSASILLVVSLMILPAVSAMLLANRFGHVQVISIALAVVGSAAGVFLSLYVGDGLPISPSVVAVLAVLFLVALAAGRWRGPRRVCLGLVAALFVAAVGLTGVSLASWSGGVRFVEGDPTANETGEVPTHTETLEQLSVGLASQDYRERIEAVRRLAIWDDPHAEEMLLVALDDDDAVVRREAIGALGASKGPRAEVVLTRYLDERQPDAGMEYDIAEALVRLRSPEAVHTLIHLSGRSDTPVFFRRKAHQRLVELTGVDHGPDGDDAWRMWWEQVHESLHWDVEVSRYVP